MSRRKNVRGIQMIRQDRWFNFGVSMILLLLVLIVMYPIILVISSSFSSPQAVYSGRVVLWPVDLSVEGYEAVFKNRQIISGTLNSVYYTCVGTMVNLAMTTATAYPLARRTLPGRGFIIKLFVFTMFFSGGMIPNYILLMKLHMLNTRWSLIIPGAISVYNMILMRTFFQNIPEELFDAASIDGCSDFRYLIQIILPLSKPIVAVLALYYAVAHWNSYFNAMMYLTDQKLAPLQLVLRDILVSNTISLSEIADEETMRARQGIAELMKFSLIVISSLPVMVIYPFIQKYFVKGVMLGAIKG